jgi:hypothetical protein
VLDILKQVAANQLTIGLAVKPVSKPSELTDLLIETGFSSNSLDNQISIGFFGFPCF